MKNIFYVITLLLLINNSFGQTYYNVSQRLTIIQQQYINAKSVIAEVGRKNIAEIYFQRIKESQIALSQLKSSDNNQDYDLFKLNELSQSFNQLIDPSITKDTQIKKDSFGTKNLNSGILRGSIKLKTSGEIYSNPFTFVGLYDENGNYLTSSNVDTLGRFQFLNLISGNYILIANNLNIENIVSTAYPDFTCIGGIGSGCSLLDLQTVYLNPDELIENIVIFMTSTPIISGRVIDNKDTSKGIGQAKIDIYDSNQNFIKTYYSNFNGDYAISLPNAGDYYFIIQHSSYVTQIYNNVSCLNGCDFNQATLVSVANNQRLNGFNLKLTPNATISGSLVDLSTQSAIESAKVYVFNDLQQVVSLINTEYDGKWFSEPLPVGSYKIASRKTGYLTTLYNTIPCNNSNYYSCDTANLGSIISLNNSDIQNVFLQQLKGGSVSGYVADSDNNPIYNVLVQLYDSNGEKIQYQRARSDFNGYYVLPNLGDGAYYLTFTYYNYQTKLYPDISCTNEQCDIAQGTPIIIQNLNTQNNVNIQLSNAARISGKITDEEGIPIQSMEVNVNEYTFGVSQRILTDSDGNYQISNIQKGTYHVYAGLKSYNGFACVGLSCNASDSYTPIIVDGNNIIDINFQMDNYSTELSTISGIIVDSNNNPLEFARVHLRRNNLSSFITALTDSAGQYHFYHQTQGSYQVFVSKQGYETESYDNSICLNVNCFGDSYTPVQLGLIDINNIDFQIVKKQQLTVNLNSNSITPITGANYYIFDDNKNFIGFYSSDSTIDLPVGDYYVYIKASGFASKFYNGDNCFASCPSYGDLITINPNEEIIINVSLDELFRIDLSSSQDFYVEYDVYKEDGVLDDAATIYSNGKVYLSDLQNRRFKLKRNGFYSRLYDGIECIEEMCDVSTGTILTPQLNGSVNINTDLNPIAQLRGRVTNTDGEALSLVELKLVKDFAFNTPSFGWTQTDENGNFIFPNAPNGDYYLVAIKYGNEGYISTYYGNYSCFLTDCLSLNIPRITINPNDNLTGKDIVLNKKGSISGDGIFDLSGTPTPAQVYFYSLDRNEFTTSNVKYDGNLLPVYLTEGSYKLIVAGNSSPTVYSLYPNQICGEELTDCLSVDVGLSQTFNVVNNNDLHFSDFEIHKLGLIKGTITSQDTNQLLSNSTLLFYKDDSLSNTSFDVSTGNFEMSLSSGEYKIVAQRNFYFDQIYNAVDCIDSITANCNLSYGASISIDYDSIVNLTIKLKPFPSIRVKMLNYFSSDPIPFEAKIYDESQNIIFASNSFVSEYEIRNLNYGSYFIIARNNEYQTVGYPQSICSSIDNLASCNPALEPIILSPLQTTSNILLYSKLNQGINGYVRDVETGLPLSNIIIDYWNDSGYIQNSSVRTNINGGFSIPINIGNYYLSTDTNNDYKNEIYNDIDCESAAILGQCNITDGELVTVPSNNTNPIIVEINLQVKRIFISGFE